jgi:hypothetical protein
VVHAGQNAHLRTRAAAMERPTRAGAFRTAAVVPAVLRPMDAAAPTRAEIVHRQPNATAVTNARVCRRTPIRAAVANVVPRPTDAPRLCAARARRRRLAMAQGPASAITEFRRPAALASGGTSMTGLWMAGAAAPYPFPPRRQATAARGGH